MKPSRDFRPSGAILSRAPRSSGWVHLPDVPSLIPVAYFSTHMTTHEGARGDSLGEGTVDTGFEVQLK